MASPGEFQRPDWDTYFMDIAHVVARRGNCRRRQVAALIVKDRRVGLAGSFPELIRVRDPRFVDKITGDFRRPEPGATATGAPGAAARETDRAGPLLEPRGGFRLPG